MKSKLFFLLVLLIVIFQPTFIAKSQTEQSIIISEIQIGGETSKYEFVELYNNSSQQINLENFKLSKKTASGNQTNLVTKFPSFELLPFTHFVITHPDYNIDSDLNYSTSSSIASNNTIILYGSNNEILDTVGFGTATVFEEDATTTPENNSSITRFCNNNIYQDTNNNKNDFYVNNSPSIGTNGDSCTDNNEPPLIEEEGEENNDDNTNDNTDTQETVTIETTENEIEEETIQPVVIKNIIHNAGEVTINEFCSNPAKGDTEWVELFNNTAGHINLHNWYIQDGSGKKTTLNGTIGANNFFVVYKINGNLNNSNDSISLYFEDKLINKVTYGKGKTNAPVPPKSFSTARITERRNFNNDSTDFVVTTTPTIKSQNIITPIVTKKVSSKKTQTVTKSGSTGENITTETKEIVLEKEINETEKILEENVIVNHSYLIKKPITIIDEVVSPKKTEIVYKKILINELLPNPEGTDINEWIELFNPNETEINLNNWKLDDATGGSKPYTIKTDVIIKPNEYLIFNREETKLALNNSFDSVQIISPDNIVQDIIEYEDTEENVSLARNDNNKWQQTSTLTYGVKNIITPINNTKSNTNSEIIVTGNIIALPNQLSKTTFYVQTTENGSWQIYMKKAEFPNFKIGDVVNVVGTLSKTIFQKINVKDKEHIKIVSISENENFDIPIFEIQDINPDYINSVVTVSGTVLEKKSNKLYIDDKTEEILVYAKSVSIKNVNEGDEIKITGILTSYRNEFRIVPRTDADINVIKKYVKPISTEISEKELDVPIINTTSVPLLWRLVTYFSLLLNFVFFVRIWSMKLRTTKLSEK